MFRSVIRNFIGLFRPWMVWYLDTKLIEEVVGSYFLTTLGSPVVSLFSKIEHCNRGWIASSRPKRVINMVKRVVQWKTPFFTNVYLDSFKGSNETKMMVQTLKRLVDLKWLLSEWNRLVGFVIKKSIEFLWGTPSIQTLIFLHPVCVTECRH